MDLRAGGPLEVHVPATRSQWPAGGEESRRWHPTSSDKARRLREGSGKGHTISRSRAAISGNHGLGLGDLSRDLSPVGCVGHMACGLVDHQRVAVQVHEGRVGEELQQQRDARRVHRRLEEQAAAAAAQRELSKQVEEGGCPAAPAESRKASTQPRGRCRRRSSRGAWRRRSRGRPA